MKEIYKSDIEIEAIQLILSEENKTEIMDFIPKIYNPIIKRENDKKGWTELLHLEFKIDNNTFIVKERDYIVKINKEIFVMQRELFENIFFKKDIYLKKELKCKSCGKIIKTLKDIQCYNSKNTYYDLKFQDGRIIYSENGTLECDFKFSCPVCGTPLDIKKEEDILKLLK
jgi:predicted RNA-binding Zn-ribbon protein involved in translation (DUF1610 family)